MQKSRKSGRRRRKKEIWCKVKCAEDSGRMKGAGGSGWYEVEEIPRGGSAEAR